ncbi:MAG: MFS transporter [Dehalococcoidia bacterium]|nr:MFS transporter [Dehalococcoidia bacterium]
MAHGSVASRTFVALGNQQYRILWFGTLFSFLGMQMQVLARGYLAFDLTGKNGALGLVTLGFGVPQLLLSLWGGVLADRLPKRNTLIVAQALIALNSAWIASMIAFDLIEFWMLVVASVNQGTLFSVVGPARQAFIGDLVGREHVGNAVVLQQMSMNSTRVVGPSLAGIFIAIPLIGLAGVYLMTTAGFLIACVSMLKLPPGAPKPRETARSPLADLNDGLRYVRARPAIWNLILVSFAAVMFGFPYQTFLPSIAKDVYGVGASGLGIMSGATAVGAVISTILVAAYADSPKAWFAAPILAVVFGLTLAALGASPGLMVGLVVLIGVGGFAAAFQSLNNSLTMSYTDGEYHGRVQSMTMLSWSLFGIAALPLGILADRIGIRETLAVMGGITIVLVILIQLFAHTRGASRDRFTGLGISEAERMGDREAADEARGVSAAGGG